MTRQRFLSIVAVVALVAAVGAATVLATVERRSLHNATTIPLSPAHLAAIDSAGLSTGPLDARVAVRILGDYECGACQQLDATAGRELRVLASSNALRFTYIHAPLAVHRRGPIAAAASYCAADQGEAWAFHQTLYERAAEWASGEPAELGFGRYATQLGLDAGRLSACLDDPVTRARVQRDHHAALAAGQSYVPVVIIDDQIVRGASPTAILAHVRDRLAAPQGNRSTSNGASRSSGPNHSAAAVAVAPVRRGDLTESIDAIGTVHARRTVVLKAEVSSSVVAVAAREGDPLRAGDVVATFDRSSLELSLRDALLRRDQAALGFEEATLFDERIPDAALRRSRARHARLRSGLAAAELGVTRAERDLQHAELRSPFGGVITRVHSHAGDVVRPGQEVAEISALDTVVVEATVLETDLSRIHAGAPARIHIPAGGPRVLAGAVTAVPTVVDSTTRSGAVRIAVPHTTNGIRPGMFATVSIEVARHRDQVIVPRASLVERDGRTLLFLYRGNGQLGRAQWRYVAVEAQNDSAAAIAAVAGDPPIGIGDRVIISGHSALVHEALVRLNDSHPS